MGNFTSSLSSKRRKAALESFQSWLEGCGAQTAGFPPENKLFSVGILLGFFFKVNVVASATAAMIIRNFWESKAICHQPRLAPEA